MVEYDADAEPAVTRPALVFSDDLADLAASSQRQFLSTYVNTGFLQVKLDGANDQLEVGLSGSGRRARIGAPLEVIDFATHVIALEKRDDASGPFPSRVSIGRARNADIVLRHESVSKFHAWFERDEVVLREGPTACGGA